MKFRKALLIGAVYILAKYFLEVVSQVIKIAFRPHIALILIAAAYTFTIGFIVWFMANDVDFKR